MMNPASQMMIYAFAYVYIWVITTIYNIFIYIYIYIYFVMIKPTNLPNAPRGAVGRAVIFVAITVFHGCEPPTISGMHIHAITVVITTINTFDSLTKL